jgi:hypothetical protein
MGLRVSVLGRKGGLKTEEWSEYVWGTKTGFGVQCRPEKMLAPRS